MQCNPKTCTHFIIKSETICSFFLISKYCHAFRMLQVININKFFQPLNSKPNKSIFRISTDDMQPSWLIQQVGKRRNEIVRGSLIHLPQISGVLQSILIRLFSLLHSFEYSVIVPHVQSAGAPA